MQRRDFVEQSLAAGMVFASTAHLVNPRPAHALANDKISIAAIGVKGRGGHVLQSFMKLPEVDVKYVCDIDESVLAARVAMVEKSTGRRPQAIKDYRHALEDKSLDALVIGTPDHWHALPTIHGCQAKKDVYVEKPDGHNIVEGQTMVAAAKKHGRVVQMGTQARTGPHMLSLMDYLKTGALGKVRFAKAWESSRQGSIGHAADREAPAGIDYHTWLGSAPLRPFNPMRFHGNWRWFFDYGTGDLGNDGVHRLDMARWALTVAAAAKGEVVPEMPRAVASLGGKYYFDDDQQWPDTLMTTFDFAPGYLLTYEMRVWNAYHLHDEPEGAAVHGDQGYVIIGNTRWRAFDAKGKQIKEDQAGYNDIGHAKNFLDCLRSRAKPNADLETVGHPSSLLCHLGNAAWRAGRTLQFDKATYKFVGDEDANQYLTRAEYRKPFELPKIADI
jgi:predicted dehydrogenase